MFIDRVFYFPDHFLMLTEPQTRIEEIFDYDDPLTIEPVNFCSSKLFERKNCQDLHVPEFKRLQKQCGATLNALEARF
jgi:hypothetical protein